MRKWLKTLIPAIFCIIMLSLLTMEKVTFIWLLRILRHQDVSFEAGYVAIGTFILFPYLWSLFQMLWNISFLTKVEEIQLPPLQNLLLGIVAAFIESASVVGFTTSVATSLPVYILLPVVGSVLSVSLLSDFVGCRTKTVSAFDEMPCGKFHTIGGVIATVGPTVAALVLYLYSHINWLQALIMGLSLVGLATVWSPWFQIRILMTTDTLSGSQKRVHILYGALKVIGILLFLTLEIYAKRGSNETMENILNNFSVSWTDVFTWKVMIPLSCNMFTGIVAHGFAYLGIAYCIPVLGVVVPMLLSTPTSIALCVTVLSPTIYHIDELRDFGDLTPLLIATFVSALSWTIPYFLKTSELIRKPKFLYVPYETLFLSYGWNSIFFDQKILLSYKHDGFNRVAEETTVNATRKSRIYVCTTMYREADYEMERLLYSLQGLSQSQKIKDENCLLEANIFMDNGCSGRDLKEFAQQLVSLLVTKFSMNLEESQCFETPYGMQLRCILDGGMPLFMHLKDPVKVKPKKRWSQCMYINYVLNYKSVTTNGGRYSSSTMPRIEKDKVKPGKDTIKNIDDKIETIEYSPYPEYNRAFVDDDQGFVSRDTTPALSHCSSAVILETDSVKETDSSASSIEAEAAAVDHYPGVVNIGYLYDEADERPSQAEAKSETYAFQKQLKKYGECDPWSSSAARRYDVSIEMDTEVDDDHTYILATDADMDFEDDAVLELLHMCNSDHRLGGACGRTHPVGKNCSSIVWHQIFEYAKDFWMIKNAQNVIGSVMCAPGCFSLYRSSAIKQVMDEYASPTLTPFTVYVKDTGEDRWMATLMMIHGWRLRFSAFADNTTYCPDTFEEFFKQRRRWILSDIANALLVVQNMISLIRNNDCFTFVYVSYLLNMFINNVITPGTAIVMITAGLELVFDVPYITTTAPMAAIVFIYAIICTRTSTSTQTKLTSVLTVLMGSVFVSVAVWGSYKIVASMVSEVLVGHFRFQQHYVILMLTASLVYAALVHPRESYQIVYGFAYLFIFPAMHVLLPIYSIANIIDQSWGTRDSTKAKIPKLSCFGGLKRRRKNKKGKEENKESYDGISEGVKANTRDITEGNEDDQTENIFWDDLRRRLLGNDTNIGLEKAELAERLRSLRNKSLTGLLVVNALWLALLSFFYMGVDTPLSRLNVYGVISGALYGFTLIIQVFGLTVCRINYILQWFARYLFGDEKKMWVCGRNKKD
ncbi:hypothetical protein SNE40_023162 [Patella caerulea]|uniref:chitin synthase n=2 Tax=Patella caerulea TaxID=87958 RepID=A0AAN8G2A3_PATCE